MKTIIAPVDFSNISNNAARYAANLAMELQAKLVLFHVIEFPVAASEFPVSDFVFNEFSRDKEIASLKDELLKETSGKISIETENITGSVENEIKRFCAGNKPFAIVMGTHSPDLIDRFLSGSTTLYSVNHLHCPVIVVPPAVKYKPIKKLPWQRT